jgi:hypothetical protein
MLGHEATNSDDARRRSGDEVYLFLQQGVPSVIPLDPRETRTIDEHGPFGKIGNVVSLPKFAEVPTNGEVKNEVLERGDEVPESRSDFEVCLVGRTSPSAQGRLHADEHVIDGTIGFGIREEDVTIGHRAGSHPFFEVSVRITEVFIWSHGLPHITKAHPDSVLAGGFFIARKNGKLERHRPVEIVRHSQHERTSPIASTLC